MRKTFILMVSLCIMMMTSIANAGFNIGGLLIDNNTRIALTNLNQKYTRPLGFMDGFLLSLSEIADANDYNKLVDVKQRLNDNNNPKRPIMEKNINTVTNGLGEKGTNIPKNVFAAFMAAEKAAVSGFMGAYDIMLDEDKPTRCLTTEEITKINNHSIEVSEKCALFIDSYNKAIGKGSSFELSSRTYREVAVGKKYQEFVSAFCYPGTLVSSSQKLVNGVAMKTDTYKWTKGKSSVTVVFEGGKAVSVTPVNLK